MGTKFVDIYNCFLGKITDDLYFELTPVDTIKDLQRLLVNAIPEFEFPRISLSDYKISIEKKLENEITEEDFVTGVIWNELEEDDIPDDLQIPYVLIDNSHFIAKLTSEEINILAILMMKGWLQRQIASIEVTRMKYSGTDFKLTSQANHLAKLLTLNEEIVRQSTHMQRLYKRRRVNVDGRYVSNWDLLNYHTRQFVNAQSKDLEPDYIRYRVISNQEIINLFKDVN